MVGVLAGGQMGCLNLNGGMLGGALVGSQEVGGIPAGLGGGMGVGMAGGRVALVRSAPVTENPGLRHPLCLLWQSSVNFLRFTFCWPVGAV